MTPDRATLEAALDDDLLYAATDEIIERDGGYPCANRTHNTMSAMRRVLVDRLVEALRPTGEWQPIETAPKDGTWILVVTSYGCKLVQWDIDHWCQNPMLLGGACYPGIPTHWQPLPGAPAPIPTPETPKQA